VFINNYSRDNNVSENIINENGLGIYIDIDANNNSIFHNSIIDNTKQALDKNFTYWNNTFQEGNYWSDYLGKDNGANGRIQGDGIGDTLIPHLGLDNYPFINDNDWETMRPPKLYDPGDIDLDGEYNITWVPSSASIGFILEEDDNSGFSSPTKIYQGTSRIYKMKNKNDGHYYYRVRSYDQYNTSDWSNIVDIQVDQKPNAPSGLIIETWFEGNAFNISWASGNYDIVYYELQYRTTSSLLFSVNITHPNHYYNHTGLTDGLRYYYKVRAHDDLGRVSEFCAETSGIPKDSKAPEPPEDLTVMEVTYNSLIMTWNESIDDDVSGYHIYRSIKPNVSENGTCLNPNTPTSIEVYEDTDLEEGFSYYYAVSAVDEVPNESLLSTEMKTQTYTFNEYPQPPQIKDPPDDIIMKEDNIDDSTIKLFDWFTDVNDDALYFYCFDNENINVTINQSTGEVTLTPNQDWSGQETLIFLVMDGRFNITDEITVNVEPVNDPPSLIEIISPIADQVYQNGTTVNLSATVDDPDIPYGDYFTFQWFSSKDGDLGLGKIVNDVKMSTGNHEISVLVTDSKGASKSASVNITMGSDSIPKEKQDNNQGLIMLLIICITVLIVLIVVILLYVRKKKKTGSAPKKPKKASHPTVYGTGPLTKLDKEDISMEELEDLYLQEE
jgi:parallel beta-helix repeat protein